MSFCEWWYRAEDIIVVALWGGDNNLRKGVHWPCNAHT